MFVCQLDFPFQAYQIDRGENEGKKIDKNFLLIDLFAWFHGNLHRCVRQKKKKKNLIIIEYFVITSHNPNHKCVFPSFSFCCSKRRKERKKKKVGWLTFSIKVCTLYVRMMFASFPCIICKDGKATKVVGLTEFCTLKKKCWNFFWRDSMYIGYLRFFWPSNGINIVFTRRRVSNYFNVSNRFHRHFHLYRPNFHPFPLVCLPLSLSLFLCVRLHFCLKDVMVYSLLFRFYFFFSLSWNPAHVTFDFIIHLIFTMSNSDEGVLAFCIPFNLIHSTYHSWPFREFSFVGNNLSDKRKKKNEGKENTNSINSILYPTSE